METEYAELRAPEFQAVIVIDFDDGRLFPLTEVTPKCLLPIAGRKLLSYQLDMLSKSGIAETFIAAPEDFETPLKQFLNDYKRERMNIELVIAPEIAGTADGLRAVSDRIRGDVFVLSADFISQFSVIDLANLHRLSLSDVTMLLAVTPKDSLKEDIDQEYVGISDKGRVLLKTPTLEIDEAIDISKSLLHKCSIFNLRNDLTDIGLYLLSNWVVEYVVNNKRISSLKNDLVSYLVKRQFQSKEYLQETFPAIVHRKRPLSGLESLLLGAGKGIGGDIRNQEPQDDLLRCFAVVIDTTAASSIAASALPTPPTPMILSRLNNIPTYLALNKDITCILHTSRTPWSRITNYQKKESSVVGENTSLEGTTFKQCFIGNNCKIGQRSKLNNCVLMDNVVIGENCTIQNSVICDNVIIDNNCNLNECNIGVRVKVTTGSKLRGESITASNA